MAEYIEREALIESAGLFEVQACARGCGKSILSLAKAWLLNEVNNAPAADVVEVVRCRDCKHYHEEEGWCDNHSHFVGSKGEACHPWESSEWKVLEPTDFCSYGERNAGK